MRQHTLANATLRFCNDTEHKTGILIESFPTGLGKSYEACYAMLEAITVNPEIKFIFICNQLKNLPDETLRKIATKEFHIEEEEFNKIFLKLKSNTDCFSENYKENMWHAALGLFKEYGIDANIFKKLVRSKNTYNRIKNSNAEKEYIDQIKQDFETSESDFRKAIHRIMKIIGNSQKRLERIDTDPLFSWIREIYPVVDFDSYRIIMMSDSKFIHTIDPLVHAPFELWSETDLRKNKQTDEYSSRLQSHIIIIDEFDAFKKVVQDALIEERKDEVDAIRAYRYLHKKLPDWKHFPRPMVEESEWWKKEKKYSVAERFGKLIDNSRNIYTKYHMEYLFKQFGVDSNGNFIEPPNSSFMFNDYEPYSVGTSFTVRQAEDSKYNRILTGRFVRSTSNKISILFRDLNELFTHVARLVRDLAFNYMYSQDHDVLSSMGGESRSFINCVDSVIDAMDMDQEFAEYIRVKVLHNRIKSNNERKLDFDDPIVFSRGFSYISMRDSVSKQLQTHLYYTEFDIAPEKILRHMAERTKVIALSATGEIASPICNFDLQYLRDGGVYFHDYNIEEKERVNQLISSLSPGFEDGRCKLNIKTIPVPNTFSIAELEDLLGDEFEAEDLFNKLDLAYLDGDKKEFAGKRYLRVAQAIDEFLNHDDIQSMIGFFSAHVKKGTSGEFTTGNLKTIIAALAKKHKKTVCVQWSDEQIILPSKSQKTPDAFIVQIKGDRFEEMKEKVLDKLSGKEEGLNNVGQKVFVISAYQTIGAGQNLQYVVAPNIADKIKWIRDEEDWKPDSEREKDFDAVYLDDPTSIGPIIEYGKKDTLDNYLFYAEYLDAVGQITLDEKHKCIRNAFRKCYTPNLEENPSHFKNTNAYCLAKAQVINQALGRMCRTGWKRDNVYIFVDGTLVDGGAFSLDKEYYGPYLSYEFSKLYNKVHFEKKEQVDLEERYVDNAVRRSHNIVSILNDIRYALYGGNEEAIAKWKEIRDFVLRNPTCPKTMVGLTKTQAMLHRYGYFTVPNPTDRYWFSVRNDFNSNATDGLEISFNGIPPKKDSKTKERKWSCASSESAKLNLMNTIDYVHEMFLKEGIPTIFEPNSNLMCAPIFRNIYMGALGEIVGKTILERLLQNKILLKDMKKEHYEQFDFCIDDETFIDFKDWHENFYLDEKPVELVNWIGKKLEKCGGKRVYVINIVSERKYDAFSRYETENGGEIIAVPYLYVVNNGKFIENHEFINKMQEDALDE